MDQIQHRMAAIYDRLNGQKHLQELISVPLMNELDIELREIADENHQDVISEFSSYLEQMRKETFSHYLLDGSTRTGSYILYMYC